MLLTTLPLQTAAELPRLIPRALLVGDPNKAAPQISPDGKRLAYLARDKRGILTIWVQTIEKDDEQPATEALDRPMRVPTPVLPKVFVWQSDNKHLLFLLDQNGDEIDHLYQVDVEHGGLKDLTPYKGVRATPISGGEKYPDTLPIAMNLRDRKVTDAYRLELDTGKLTEVARNPGDVAEWFANNRGEVVAAQAVHFADQTTELRVRDSEADPWRSLLKLGPDEIVGTTFSYLLVQGFSPDDHRIRLADSDGSPASRLVEVDIASGKQTVIDEDPEADVGGMLTNPRTGEVDAVWRWKDRRVWDVLNPALKSDFDAIAALHSGDPMIENQDYLGRRWIVSYADGGDVPAFYLWDRETHQGIPLFTQQPALKEYDLARPKPAEIKTRDGATLHGYLTLPVGADAKALPMVLLVHGGPHLRDLWHMNGWVQLLANRGYAVLQVNFRGSMGYGKAFLHAGDHGWGRRMEEDLIDAKAWAVKQGIADAKRCAIAGFSYGGYATLAALAFSPKEFECGVAAAAPSDLVSLLHSMRPDWLAPRLQFAKRLGDADKDRAELEARSPLYHAEEITAPLLLGQCANDARVPASDTDRLARTLKHAGREVEYLTFPNDGHHWTRAETRLRWAEAMERFLARNLGGREEGGKVEDLLPRPFDGVDPRLLR